MGIYKANATQLTKLNFYFILVYFSLFRSLYAHFKSTQFNLRRVFI